MKDKIFGVLQRVGRSFMLPIAILPVAGLLLGFGSSFTNATTIQTYGLEKILGDGTILNSLLIIMNKVGSAVFDNLPLIFAVGVAIGMAKKEKEVAETEYLEKEKIYNQLRIDNKDDREIFDTLSSRLEERKSIVEEHARIDALYRMTSGNVSGSRMDLETYVQRYYLEHILYAANRRFQEMSAGQFELRMYDLEKAGEGKNRGLDLMVYSTVTGKEREVRTLSGGESFMAALSLALGMADQIQESSASINLDVMFVDEGFGSLDEHSREQAVKVLQELAGGSKLIGIISHVTELKQEIEDQLIVTKDEKGSHVRWQIS